MVLLGWKCTELLQASGVLKNVGIAKQTKQNRTMKLNMFILILITEVHDAVSVAHSKLGHGSNYAMRYNQQDSIVVLRVASVSK